MYLMKLLRAILLSSILLAFFPIRDAHAQTSDSFFDAQSLGEPAYQLIAPHFGKLLAFYIGNLIENERSDKAPASLIIWEADAGMLAHDVLSEFCEDKRNHTLRSFCKRLEVKTIVLNQDEHMRATIRNERFHKFDAVEVEETAFPKSHAGLFKNNDWVIIISKNDEAHFIESGFEIVSRTNLPELEFLKDKNGRQILNLDEGRIREQIVARLTKRGMSPIRARALVVDLVPMFRADDTRSIFVLSRMKAKENADGGFGSDLS